jgi:hypothetical protein
MEKRKLFLIAAAILSMTLACNLTKIPSGESTQEPGLSTGNESTQIPGPSTSTESISTPTTQPTEIPAFPISIRRGLASLDSYLLVIDSTFTGPGASDFSHMRYEIVSSKDLDASSTHSISAQSSEDSPDLDETDSYTYKIGNATCSGSEEDGWDYQESDPQTTEMMDLSGQLVDVLPLIDNPTYVGSESMNGIQCNHFTFQISGLGLKSGAQVNINQGDYWIAQDGQYVVNYKLTTETTDPTNMTTLHMEFLIDLTNVDQPVEITFPAGCAPEPGS